MTRLIAVLALMLVGAGNALAQNYVCPDRPTGDSTTACANTRFVQDAVGTPTSIDANSIFANPTASSAAPEGFGTSTGTPQYIFNDYSSSVPGINIASGSSGTPVTVAGPLWKLSRVDNVAVANCANAYDAECVAAFAAYSTATTSDPMSNVALYGGAQTDSSASGAASNSAVGVYGIGVQNADGIAQGNGAYFEGRTLNTTSAYNALGVEVRLSNFSGLAGVYNPSGYSPNAGIWVTAAGNAYGSVGVALGSADEQFTVGYAATSNSISPTGTTFRDDSAAEESVVINGTHTTGIDLTGATISGNTIQSAGFEISNAGSITTSPASGGATIYLNPQASSQQATVNFDQDNTGEWSLGKNTDNSFFLYDISGTQNVITVESGGNMTLSPKGGTTQVTGTLDVTTSYSANGTAGVSCSGAPSASFAVTNGIVTHC